MKYFFLVLLFPFQLVAQKPIRHYDFASRKQTGLFVGAFSISPKGNMLLATFNDLDKKVVYELVNTSTGKLIGTGPLPAKPLTIAWTDDEKMVAISYSTNAVCYDVNAGMKKIFSTRMDGDAVFSRNSSLLVKNFSPDLYVFGDERVYRYDSKGVLMDSTRTNMFPYYTGIWFDLLHDCFVMAEDEAAKLSAFSVKDKKLQLIAGTLSNGNASHIAADKDGSKFFYYDENDIYVHDAGNAKKITNYRFNKIASACFTPDSKNILVLDDKQVSLLDMQGKVTRTMNRPTYYSHIGYASFGLELIAAHPDGFDVYACKDYFFVKEGPVVTKRCVFI
jgi:WD40 repeat protein